jgi:hypothetical protein
MNERMMNVVTGMAFHIFNNIFNIIHALLVLRANGSRLLNLGGKGGSVVTSRNHLFIVNEEMIDL